MWIFLNVDLLADSSDAQPAERASATAAMAAQDTWLQEQPALRLVVTSDWRHRLTLDQLCAPLSPLARTRVQGTTLLYGELAAGPRPTREDEVLDWLAHQGLRDSPWLAVDPRTGDFQRHPARVLAGRLFTADTVRQLRWRCQWWLRPTGERPASGPGSVLRPAPPPCPGCPAPRPAATGLWPAG